MKEYENLKWKYKFRLMGLFVISLVLAIPILWLINSQLVAYFDLTDGPVIDQDNGLSWFYSFIGILIVCITVVSGLVLSVTGIVKGWPLRQVADIFLCRNYPNHWRK